MGLAVVAAVATVLRAGTSCICPVTALGTEHIDARIVKKNCCLVKKKNMALTSEQILAMFHQNMRAPAPVIHVPVPQNNNQQRQKLWLFIAGFVILFFVLRTPGVSDMLFDLARIVRIVSVMALAFGGVVIVGNMIQRAPEDHPMMTTYSRPSISSHHRQALLASLARPLAVLHEDDESTDDEATDTEVKGTEAMSTEFKSTEVMSTEVKGTEVESVNENTAVSPPGLRDGLELQTLDSSTTEAHSAESDAPGSPSGGKRTKKQRKSQRT